MSTGTTHIAILCSRLDLPGGIERAVVNTANLFVSKGNRVTLVVLDETIKSFYPVDPAVKIIGQPLSFGISEEGNIISRKIKLLGDTLKLRRIIKGLRADTIISTEYPFTVAAVLAGGKKYSKLLAWEHHHHSWLKKNKFWSRLYNLAYPKLNGIICLNKEEADHFRKYTTVSVIPNFIENRSGKFAQAENKTILSVGWLIPRKGIDLMMEAAKIVLNKHPDWTWKLIGDGEMKEQVLGFITKNNLENRFVLQAPVNSDIQNEYLAASIFGLSSRYEAFPMVLLEAMSLGMPCISFDCPSGPSEIINPGIDGLLVEKENPVRLAEAISTLINDDVQRQKMSANAQEAIKRFSPEKIFAMWKEYVLDPL